jgi:hypothetical protein
MGKLFIPPLGTEFTLKEDWTFRLHREHRNAPLIGHLGVKFPEADFYERQKQSAEVTLPAGSTLKIDRIFIRKGAGDFDSVTFYLKGATLPSEKVTRTGRRFFGAGDGDPFTYTVTKPKRAVRFWAKLEDANKIVFEDVL